MKTILILLLFIHTGLISLPASAGLAINRIRDITQDIQQSVDNTEQNIQGVRQAVDNQGDGADAWEQAQRVATDTERQMAEINLKLEELKTESQALEDERLALEEERNRLVQEKKEIEEAKQAVEKREQLFATGFFTTLLTTVIGLAGFIFRLPHYRLERELKKIEIATKEYELSVLKGTA